MSAQKGALFGYKMFTAVLFRFRNIPNVAGFLNHIKNLIPKQNFQGSEIMLLLKKRMYVMRRFERRRCLL